MGTRCQSCKAKEAEIKCIVVIDGERIEKKLCVDCARIAGIDEQAKMNRSKAKEFVVSANNKTDLICPQCKLAYSNFLNSGQLGCPTCYSAFGTALRDILKGIHSSSYHRGRGPGEENSMDIAQLRWKLSEAVREEDFELAAKLRDEIRVIEKDEN